MSDIFNTFGSIIEGALAARRTTAKNSNLNIIPAVPQGHYPAELTVTTWGYAHYTTRDQFVPPPFNVNDIDIAIWIDGIASSGIKKYEQLIFKEGIYLDAKRPELKEYIEKRFDVFSLTAAGGMEWILKAIASDILRYGNAVFAKSRYRKEQMGKVKRLARKHFKRQINGITGIRPVSGYWRQEIGQMEARRDDKGVPISYQQVQNNQPVAEWPAKDVAHFTHDKPAKDIWGRPLLLPVLDDIKLLRSMEHHAVDLFYRYLNPLVHIAVNAKDTVHGGLAPEGYVERYAQLFNTMPPNGVIVTDGLTTINSVNSNEGVPTRDFLDYFSQRVMIGMGLSDVVLGVGNTSNRGTSDTMVALVRDNIKAFQESIARQFNELIIREMLLEAGVDILDPRNKVEVRFREIDIDLEIKKNQNAVTLWQNNAVSHEEFRRMLGMDVIKPVDEKRLYTNMIEKSVLKMEGDIQKDVGTAVAKARPAAVAGAGGTSTKKTPSKTTGKSTPKSRRTSSKRSASTKVNPSNQHGKRTGTKRSTEDYNQKAIDNTIGWLAQSLTTAVDAAQSLELTELDPVKDIDNPLIIAIEGIHRFGHRVPVLLPDAINITREIVNDYIYGDIELVGMIRALEENVFFPPGDTNEE
jgi:hypothetical protein